MVAVENPLGHGFPQLLNDPGDRGFAVAQVKHRSRSQIQDVNAVRTRIIDDQLVVDNLIDDAGQNAR